LSINCLTIKIKSGSFIAAALFSVCSANGIQAAELDVTSFLDVSLDENPRRVSEGAAEFVRDERRDTAGLNVQLTHEAASSEVDIGYRIARDRFDKSSQEDLTAIIGQSFFSLGSEDSFYGLDLTHQITQRANTPDAAEVTTNLNEVSTARIEPRLSTNPRNLTTAQLLGVFTAIDFEDNDIRLDTEQKGAELRLARTIYNGGSVFTSLSASETSFDSAPDLDYDYRRSGIGFASEAKLLSYQIQVGVNTLTPKVGGSEESGPYFFGSLSYDSTLTRIESQIQSELSASSIVSSLNGDSAANNLLGVDGDEDRVEFNRFNIFASTDVLCARCRYSIGFEYQTVNNINLSENDVNVRAFSTQFSYNFTRATRLNLDVQKRELIFPNDGDRDTRSLRFRSTLSRTLTRLISVELYASREDFVGDLRRYDSSIYGLRLNADLY